MTLIIFSPFMTHAFKIAVIPAQAGIQLIEKLPRSGAISKFCPLRVGIYLLDSRLRGNDEMAVFPRHCTAPGS